jgi:cytochrome b involved in lipid metabolism
MRGLIVLIISAFFAPLLKAEVYTKEQVKEHDNEISCWIIIDEKVFDVTRYLERHPKKGRKELIESCGKDATKGWNQKGDKQKPHSAKARKQLEGYEIGHLKQ